MRATFRHLSLLGLFAAMHLAQADDELLQHLYTRTFRVDPNPLLALDFPELINPTPTEMIRAHLQRSGLQFPLEDNPRRLFYNDRTGVLLVRATLEELARAEMALQKLNVAPHQVQIEVKVIEYNPEDLPANLPENLITILRERQEPQTLKASVLTDPETRLLIRAFEQTPADLISAPTVTTLSGRQARLSTERQPPVITDPPFTAPGKSPKATWSR